VGSKKFDLTSVICSPIYSQQYAIDRFQRIMILRILLAIKIYFTLYFSQP
jgi:hypothetical protein